MGNVLSRREKNKSKKGKREPIRERVGHFRMLMQGDGGVGKTALCTRFAHDTFLEEYDPTIEDSYRKQVILNIDEQLTLFDLSDSPSFEEYIVYIEQPLLDTHGFFFVYSITSKESFHQIVSYIEKVMRVKDVEVPVGVLIGNKVDLGEEERQVTKEEGEEMALRFKIPFIETSAKTGEMVDEMFQTLGSFYFYGEPFYNLSLEGRNIKAAR